MCATISLYIDYKGAVWDGKSKGTKYVIDNCKKQNIELITHIIE